MDVKLINTLERTGNLSPRRLTQRLCFLVALLWTTSIHAAETATPAPVVVSEQQALKLFYERNLDLITAHYDLERGEAEQIIAAALPNPSVDTEFYMLNEMSYTKQVSPAVNKVWPQGYMSAWSIRIEQLIITAGKRALRMESSALGTEALGYDLRDLVRILSNALRHAYYNLLLTQKNVELFQHNLDRYHEILHINKTRLDIGDIAETDFTRIEVEALKSQADLNSALATLKQAQTELLLLMGWPENALDIRAAEQWPDFNIDISRKSLSELTGLALENRPDLAAARIRLTQAEKNNELARRMVIPDVTLIGFYLKDPSNFYTSTGGVGVSFDLPVFYRQEGEIAKAGVDANSSRLTIRQTEQEIRADVLKAQAAWVTKEEIRQRFEKSSIPRIEALRKGAELAYQKGDTGLLELLDAERNYKVMMQDYYHALADRSNAWADLIMATGVDLH
ncbi:TolC family protein [Candidatus Methylospira mobilis]|nr:TolC family protein [Candidatus Methylospira mobilis]WNV04238.1 TolC family protein [Candidatus Methylospira mobilis]